MKKTSIAMLLTLLLSTSTAALAAVVHVSGSGQSFDPGIALEDARVDAVNRCTAQGGTPIKEVYNHVSRNNMWSASSIWSCEVP